LKREPAFQYVIDSVMNRRLLAEMVDECDIVFHLAAAVGVRLIVESPIRTLHTNVQATELVLEAASKKKKKVLITSTSEVYGKSEDIPFRESGDLVIGPPSCGRWSYACSKALDEFLAVAYNRERQVPVVIVRLFNTVGPRQTGMYGMVLPRFVMQALRNQPITIYGDGTQTRCFGWIGDVVGALVKLAQLPAAENLLFNIGSDEEVSINKLAQVVKAVTGSSSPLQYIPYEQAYSKDFEDMPRRVPDLTRIRTAVGYAPTKKLREIVEAVASSFTDSIDPQQEPAKAFGLTLAAPA
jgi:UDP-glucose 4-epimerase